MAEWGTFSDGSTVEEIQILDLSKEAGVTTALSLEGEADFFKFTLDTTAGVGSKLSLTGIDASELSFCVYDSEGSLMGFSVDGSAGVSLANLTAGDYYVKVTGTEKASYSISHTITAPPAVSVDRADNFVVLFSGGYNPRSNRPYYYYNIKEIYTLLTEEYEIDPACIYILYADGDSQEPDNSGNTNSDMSFAGSSTVLSATDENLRNVFREISVSADSNDHLLFYSFDHGAESFEGTDYLCGWGEMIEDSDFAEYVSWISAGYQTYIMSQCYSGGMLEDITVEGNIFVAGSSAGDKVSHTVVDNETGRAAEGFSVSVEEALKQGITDTHALYQYIYKENPYSETDGSYMAGGDFAIFGSGEVVPDENGNNGGDTTPVTGGLKVYDSPVYKELTEAAAGSTVAVAAKALALEADAEITEVAFYLKDKNGRTKLLYTDKYASDGWQFLWQIADNQAAGEYVISARAKDSEGRYSTASEMEFLVREKNYHPEIISIDLEYEAYRAGSEITVCGVAQDKDSNGIDSVRIYLDMDGDGAFLYPEEYLGITGVDSEGKWSFTFTVDAKSAVGSYRIMAEAIDALDMLAGQSRSVGFQVTEYKVSGFEVKGSQLQWLNLDAGNCILEFSADNFKNAIIIETWNNLVDLYNFTGSDYEVRAAYSNNVWNEPVSINNIEGGEAARFVAECNGGLDLFFVRSSGVWGTGYSAGHAGIAGVWEGTGERVALGGKNRFADVFEGSEDANILFLTDDEQGDALFADDIYTAAPGKSDEARVVNIKEIRAGAGDDIVDMTSDRFVSTGGVMTIFGGEGNDTIWANRGSNTLFGDGGNDRIVGGCDADTIVGGAGDDSLHGGGGDDLFVFGKKWGNDTVTQLAGGKVTLWFAEGDETNWNAEEMSFTYSGNTVKVSGVSADDVTLKFGNDGSDLYTTLCSAGAFSGSASQKVSTSNKKYSIETNEIIENTILSDSTVYVQSGEAATSVTLENGGELYLSGGSAFDTYISGGYLTVNYGGYASGVTIDGWRGLYVYNGSAEDIIVNSGIVSVGIWGSTAIVSNTTLNGYNVSMFISSGGSAIETYVNEGGQVYVGNSGFAQDTSLEGGSMYISSGGTASEVQIQQYAGVDVSSGGSLASATLNCDGYLNIESGGTISDTVVNEGAHLTISEGVKANKTTLNAGSLTVSSGGSANGVTVSNGGYLHVESGGTALKVDWTPCDGIVSSAAGASVTYASALTGVYMGSNGSLVSHTNYMSYESRFDLMYIMSNGEAQSIGVYGADVYVSKGGTISWSEIREGGSVFVESGGYASTMSVRSSGFMQIANGGSGSNIDISGGVLQIDSGASVTSVCENGGYVHVADGAEVTFASNTISGIEIGNIYNNAVSATIHKNTVLEDATVIKAGHLEIFEGGSATNLVENGGYVYVEEGAIVDFAENTFGNCALINSATVHKNTVAENLDVQNSGYLYIYDGGSATGIKENGGYVEFTEGAVVDFVENTFSGTIYRDASLHSKTTAQDVRVYGGRLHAFAGGVASNVSLYGNQDWYWNDDYTSQYYSYYSGEFYIYAGGSGDNVTVGSGGVLHVSSGGVATAVKEDGGFVSFDEGASIEFVSNTLTGYLSAPRITVHENTSVVNATVGDRAQTTLYICSGGIADNTRLISTYDGEWHGNNWVITAYYNGSMVVESSGSATSTTVDRGGYLTVLKGGKATAIKENGGFVTVEDGANVEFVSTVYSGWMDVENMTVHSNTSVVNATVHYGNLHICKGGVASNISLDSGAALHISSGGLADTVNIEGSYNYDSSRYTNDYVFVYDGGQLNNATVRHGGYLTISSGGTATAIKENGGFVVVEDGANVEFVETIMSGGYSDRDMTAHSNTIFSSARIYSGALHLIDGGIASNVTLSGSGILHISSGGWANSTVLSGGSSWDGEAYHYESAAVIISSGGKADNTKLYNSTYMYILDGGIASNTLIGYGCSMYISSGGTANSTTLTSSGRMYIAQGATVNHTVISGGSLNLNSGITANSTVVAGGSYTVQNGATANQTTVNNGGYLYVYSGGTATQIIENGGYVGFHNAEDVEFASHTMSDVTITGSATIHRNTVAENVSVYMGQLYIYEGGIANNIDISGSAYYNTAYNRSGYVTVFSGATVTNAVINSLGNLTVHSGATVTNAVIDSLGNLTVNSGGTAEKTLIHLGGSLIVSSGGTATIEFTPWQQGTVTSADGASVTYLERDANIYFGYNNRFVSKCDAIDNITVAANDAVIVYSGGSITQIVENGGYIEVAEGANVEFASNTIKDLNLRTSMTVHSNTIADKTTVSTGGKLYISSGGIANSTTVSSGGNLHISSGGTVNNTTVSSGGGMYISSGGVANSTTVNSSGYMYISSGGTANSTTVNFSGYMYISSGGTVNNTTVSSGGGMYISNGGTANSTTVSYGGYMRISNGGTANSTTFSGGVMYISNGGTANSTTFNGQASMYISSGGVANDTTVNMHCTINISNGGIANSTTINTHGKINISNGGIANSTTVNDYGAMCIHSGGVANDTTVSSGGSMFISSGGTATRIVENGGYVEVAKGAEVTFAANTFKDITIAYRSATVHSNTIAENTTIGSSGYMTIFEGGIADRTTVTRSGYMYISSGGIADCIIINAGGKLYISEGGIANSTTLNSSGNLYVSEGGIANSTTVSGGTMYICSGCTANSTTISGGSMYISAGAVADGVSFGSGAYISLEGTMHNAELLAGNRNTLTGSGKVENMTVYENAFLTTSNTEISGLMVEELGAVYVSGGMISDSEVENLGILQYCAGTVASNTVVNSGGHCYIGSGAFHQGEFNIEEGATVIAFTGSLLDFTLVGRAADDEALVTNLSAISGNISYSITVSTDQASGLYTLADNVETFTQDVDLYFGDLLFEGFNVGETIETEFVSFELILEDNTLFLEVESDLPVAAAFSALQSPPHDLAGTPPELLADGLAGNEQTYGLLA